jgi:hypothetical protein
MCNPSIVGAQRAVHTPMSTFPRLRFAQHYYAATCILAACQKLLYRPNDTRYCRPISLTCVTTSTYCHSGRVLLLRAAALLLAVVTGVAGTVTTTVVGSLGLPVITVVVLVPEPRTEPIGS